MTDIRRELTYSISEDAQILLVREDSIGNLDLTYKEGSYLPDGHVFVPKEFIPHLIEVLKEFTK